MTNFAREEPFFHPTGTKLREIIDTDTQPKLTTSLGIPSVFISWKISKAVLGCRAFTLTAMRELIQYVLGWIPAFFIISRTLKSIKMVS